MGGNRWKNVEPAERLLAKADFDEITGCWEYRGKLNSGGYGAAWLDGRVRPWHRACYMVFVGPIPDGMELDHLCRNRKCGNPGHLEPVSRRENLLRGNGWSGRNARKTHCPVGHEYTDENTSWYRGQRKCRTCHATRERVRKARLYGHLNVNDIRKQLEALERR